MNLNSRNLPQEISTDVLIIGGGLAAVSAAIEAVKFGIKVTLIDKGGFGASGSSPIAGGGLHPFLPPELGGDPTDSKDELFREIIETGQYLNEQKMVEIYVEESTENLLFLEKLGIPFVKRPDGKFDAGQAWSLKNHISKVYGPGEGRRNISTAGVHGGLTMMQGLRKEALHREVRVLENIMVTKLLSLDGTIIGAIGIDTRNGDYYIFKTKSTVLVAGSATKLSANTGVAYVTTGDAYALAYEAGGVFMNMEFISLKMNTKPKGIEVPQGIGQTGPLARGITRNALGEAFIDRLGEAIPPSVLGGKRLWACLQEIKAGRGPIYEDVTHYPPEMYEDEKGKQTYEFLKTLGYDIRKEWIERQPPETHDFLGGLRVNEKGETALLGLYSAGESSGHNGSFGAERRPGVAMMSCLIFGKRAGRYAAERARRESSIPVEAANVKEEIERMKRFSAGKGTIPEELEKEVRRYGSKLCGLRDETNLKETIKAFVEIGNREVFHASVSNIGELIKVLEIGNLALSGELVARAALMRTETRGTNLREDYPLRNDNEWLRWVLLKKEGEKMKVWTEPLPFHLYKLKPPSMI